jgi:hypothetical protein
MRGGVAICSHHALKLGIAREAADNCSCVIPPSLAVGSYSLLSREFVG